MKKTKKKVVGIVVVSLIVVVAAVYMINSNKAQEVEMATVVKGNISEYVEEIGVVKSENNRNVFSTTAGKVSEVLVDIGDKVEEGELLLKIDNENIAEQIKGLEAQKAVIAAQYREASKPADAREIEKLQLQLNTQERRVEEAQRKLDSNKKLYEEGAISNEEYQATITALESEEAQLKSMRLDLELLKKPISSNIASQYEAQLKQLDIQIETLKNKEQDFVIASPMKGTVMAKEVEVGTYLQPGMSLIEIGNSDTLYLESDVLVSEIGKVKVDASVEISYNELGIQGIKGNIRKIYPKAFSKISDLGIEQKRIKVEINIGETVVGLRPEYDLDVKIIATSKENTLLIPESAVFENEDKNYVFVNENGKAVLREIRKGLESGKEIEVVSGLNEGEKIILSPDDDVEEGMSIKNII